MASIFSRIASGEIPSYRIAENDKFFAFLDINPVAEGHVLVIPRKETDYIFDLSDEDLGEMMIFAKKVAKALKAALPCRKIGVSVIGLEVPHAHIHLVPMNNEGDMDFRRQKLSLEPNRMTEIATAISAEFDKRNK